MLGFGGLRFGWLRNGVYEIWMLTSETGLRGECGVLDSDGILDTI
jgi:hypothetical protein